MRELSVPRTKAESRNYHLVVEVFNRSCFFLRDFTEDPNDSDYRSDDSGRSSPVPAKKHAGQLSSVMHRAVAIKMTSSISQASSFRKNTSSDPLAEFYEQAKAEIEVILSHGTART